MEFNTFYDIYLEELKNLPQGTPEEEAALLKKTDGGGQDSGFPSDGVKTGEGGSDRGGVPRSGTSGGRSGAGGKYGAVSVRKRVRKR